MAGRRLLDAAKLFSAGRAIAKQHIALRQSQFDVYTKTSTLAKAAKSQTDRVTLTAQAAIALAKRFNEPAPPKAYDSPTERWRGGDDTIPRAETVAPGESGSQENAAAEGLNQDHHYKRDVNNAAVEPVPQQELEVTQKKAAKDALPDGTIPPSKQDLSASAPSEEVLKSRDTSAHDLSPEEARRLQRQAEDQIPRIFAADHVGKETIENKELNRETLSERIKDTTTAYSSLPRQKIPKNTGDTQAGDEHVDTGRINQDVYYTAQGRQEQEPIPSRETIPQQDEMLEGINTDVFHSPRIASMLTGNQKKGYGLDLRAASRTPVDHSKIAEGHDQDTFNVRLSEQDTAKPPREQVAQQSHLEPSEKEMRDLAADIAKDAESSAASSEQNTTPDSAAIASSSTPYHMRESRVPSSRFGRFWQFSGLATNMALGAVGEGFRRIAGAGAGAGSSLILSPGNLERLVTKLSRMRGAALKLGQMISFQDLKMLPPAIHEVLQRVQDSADYMPASQRDRVLSSNLGSSWRKLFSVFDEVPIAAASIGQVHRAVLAATGEEIAVKVQYPGVATSIDSDLSNLSLLLTASRLLPKGLFLDKTIANARVELAWETDYDREAEACTRFRDLLASDKAFAVPRIIPEASGKEVLTAELMHGIGVTKLKGLSQDTRDWIGTQILRLCLREMTEFKFMQTDPNWTNFLYNDKTKKLELLDFGASREYPDKFLTPYIQTLIAASRSDHDTIRSLSIQLGYLTGSESNAMAKAHVESVMTLAEPFSRSAPEVYDFQDQTITDRVRSQIPLMVRERLAPPPEETYSLHRKLSGAFLLCARLGSRVRCRELFENAVGKWEGR
ncbi:ubiquinone biosynthesis protein-like protein coq-8 [Rhizodiscina lignyota]|uniref:Ubiquinone biosynthesis protein-like protein coq-8 n=1 Tax=Rhizodiscina lignyota TaxID=1504668 RepID=A0A9P4M492_9PEZI|nr:ubiquinone biosynthesis protein-like protein coq-8 [Rhizodiscina lignyota]